MKKLNHRSENKKDLWFIEFKSVEHQLSDIASQMNQIDDVISELDGKALVLLSHLDTAFSLVRELDIESIRP